MLLHPPIEPWVRRVADGLQLTLLGRDLDAADVGVRVLLDNEEYVLPLPERERHGRWTQCRGTVPWCGSSPGTRYAFRVIDTDGARWLGAAGPRRRMPRLEEHYRVARQPIVPAWAADAIVYQIFPDRYARASDAPVQPPAVHGSTPATPQVRTWGESPADAKPSRVFYGGDLPGIEQRLPHLQALGVDTLYLNPVFLAGSNHRYNTEDYTQVCPLLGGNAALAQLARSLHERGMKLVLDAVLNHTGTHHPWFQRRGAQASAGAAPGAPAASARWYACDAEGRVVGWKGHASLPVLDYANPEVLQAMVSGADSVLRRWLRPPVQADGWRLDAVHMIGAGAGAAGNAGVVRAIRAAVKGERADALLVGEHFGQADRWLQGDQEDAAMNYWGFTQPLWAWLAGRDYAGQCAELDTDGFVAWLLEALAAVPYEVQLAQWNSIDSHDVPRLATVLDGDGDRLAAAAALQFTWAGVPCIYYGDEIALEGGGDPDNRRCFPWDESQWKQPLLEHYRRLAAWRRSRTEWRRGALQPLAHGEHWLAFARYTSQALTVVIVARAAVAQAATVPLDGLPFEPRRLAWAPLPAGVQRHHDQLTLQLPHAGGWVVQADLR